MASSPSYTTSGLSSAPSSLIPPPRAKEYHPSGSSGDQSGLASSSSGVMTQVNIKALQALEIMKSCHDFDCTMSLESLATIQKRYSILNEYQANHATRTNDGMKAYDDMINNRGINGLSGFLLPLTRLLGCANLLVSYLRAPHSGVHLVRVPDCSTGCSAPTSCSRYVVPPQSSTRRRAYLDAVGNTITISTPQLHTKQRAPYPSPPRIPAPVSDEKIRERERDRHVAVVGEALRQWATGNGSDPVPFASATSCDLAGPAGFRLRRHAPAAGPAAGLF
ncbi:hypothetical protein BHE74_00031455 [Ensete ventricosum]|nr:hypothetical protein BHE74_00031455 [Ensete ventricosum]